MVSAQLCHALAYEDKAVDTSSNKVPSKLTAFTQCWFNVVPLSGTVTQHGTSTGWAPAQQTRHVEPMLVQCWLTVYDVGPALNQHWFNVSCLLGGICRMYCDVRRQTAVTVTFQVNSLSVVCLCCEYYGLLLSSLPGYRFCVWRGYPANTRHCAIVGSMLVQRRRRWTNIKPTMTQCLVFAG